MQIFLLEFAMVDGVADFIFSWPSISFQVLYLESTNM